MLPLRKLSIRVACSADVCPRVPPFLAEALDQHKRHLNAYVRPEVLEHFQPLLPRVSSHSTDARRAFWSQLVLLQAYMLRAMIELTMSPSFSLSALQAFLLEQFAWVMTSSMSYVALALLQGISITIEDPVLPSAQGRCRQSRLLPHLHLRPSCPQRLAPCPFRARPLQQRWQPHSAVQRRRVAEQRMLELES